MNGDNNPLEYEKDKLFCLVIILLVSIGGIVVAAAGTLS